MNRKTVVNKTPSRTEVFYNCFIYFLLVFFTLFIHRLPAGNPIKSAAAKSQFSTTEQLYNKSKPDFIHTFPDLLDLKLSNSKAFSFKKEIPSNEETAKLIQQKSVRFLENKGQMMSTSHEAVPFVLFKASSRGLDFYITEKGMTYVFVKTEEEESDKREKKHSSKADKASISKRRQEKITTKMSWINVYLKNATIKRENIIKEGESTEHQNYFYGHCPKGIYNVKQYQKVTIKNVYSGIDWVLYNTSENGMKYDFIVHPGADPSQIKLIYESEKSLKMDESGNLKIKTPLGTLTENAPYSYVQETDTVVKSSFTKTVIDKHNVEVGFSLPNFKISDSQTLVIDPQLVWATFYGDWGIEGPMTTECDINGNLYIGGYTSSNNLPIQIWAGTGNYNQATANGDDVFILRFTNTGVLTWATYYGGNDYDILNSIKTDGAANIYVTGSSYSSNLPMQNWPGAYNQPVLGSVGLYSDVFILRFTNTGALTWATYYGGSDDDHANCIEVDATGNIYITGYTASPDFPIQAWAGAFNQPLYSSLSNWDSFIVRFTSVGVRTWATYFNGASSCQANSIETDGAGNIYVTGWSLLGGLPIVTLAGAYNQSIYGGGVWDLFILRFTNTGVLTWATYYGGSGDDNGTTIRTDGSANVYIIGSTSSSNLPTQAWAGAYNQSVFGGVQDFFILRFTNTGALTWATYYGGSLSDGHNTLDNIEIDACGNFYVTNSTNSTDMPVKGSSSCGQYFDATYNGNGSDVFISKFSAAGELLWATYFGGGNSDFRESIALDNNGNLFIAGEWQSVISTTTYPLTDPGGGTYYNGVFTNLDDAYIAKFTPATATYSQSQVNPTSCSCNGMATVSLSCGEPPYSFQWSNSVSVLNTTLTTHSISGVCPGVYQVTVTNNCNSSYVTSYTLTGAVPNLTANITTSSISCSSSTGSVTIASVTNGVPNYTITEGTSTLGANVSTPYTISPVAVGTHTYVITSVNGCSTTFTANILSDVSPPNINILSSGSLTCFNASVTLTGSSTTSGATFSWSPQNVTTNTAIAISGGNYSLMITDPINGCTSTSVVSVSQNTTVPNISASVGSTLTCTNTSVTLTGTSTTSGVTFSWSPQNVTTNTAVASNPGNYSLEVTDPLNGCVSTSIVAVTQNIITPNITASNNASICPNTSIVLTSTSTTGGIVHSWSPNVVGTTSLSMATVNLPGSYTLTVTDPINGCTSNTVIIISSLPVATATFDINGSGSYSAETNVTFNSFGVSGNWSFGDGSNSTIVLDPSHIFNLPGNYCVKLVTPTTTLSCSDSLTKCLDVIQPANIEIPNVFTPNADGINDVFKVRGTGISYFHCIIFNRWGLRIYEWVGVGGGWDGYTEAGVQVSNGTYYFVITYSKVDEKHKVIKGYLSLFKD